MAIVILLGLNGFEIEATQAEVVTTMLAAAAGQLTETQLVEWVREHLAKLA